MEFDAGVEAIVDGRIDEQTDGRTGGKLNFYIDLVKASAAKIVSDKSTI